MGRGAANMKKKVSAYLIFNGPDVTTMMISRFWIYSALAPQHKLFYSASAGFKRKRKKKKKKEGGESWGLQRF
jgi:hypothetical protein